MKSSKKQLNKISGRAREQRILERLFATQKAEFWCYTGGFGWEKRFLLGIFLKRNHVCFSMLPRYSFIKDSANLFCKLP